MNKCIPPPPPTSRCQDAFALALTQLNGERPFRNLRLKQIAFDVQNNKIGFAEHELRRHLESRPDDADAIYLVAQIALRRGRLAETALQFARCLTLAPEFVRARFEYARVLHQLHQYNAALDETDRLLLRDCRNPLFRQLKASILNAVAEDERSLSIWEELAVENPLRPEIWIRYGDVLRGVGRQAKAIDAYRKAIESSPSFGAAWWGLANLKTYRFSAAEVAVMEEQLKSTDIVPENRIGLLFSLGKAYEDLRSYGRSFEYYAKASTAKRLMASTNEQVLASRVADKKSLFTSAFLRTRRNAGCQACDPIFVLGRPRSGSTLIEQILSTHSAIEATAELPYILDLASRFLDRECRVYGVGYPHVIERLDTSTFAALGEEYLAKASVHRRLGRSFFIDKNPANYHHVGLIELILPNAKIIDARRHPVASCLSLFKHNYGGSNLRLSELGRVYREYVAVMQHFDSVLPGRIHRTFYEQLVADPEVEIRKLLHYLGLPFEENCLRFYETERTIRTPSSEQVRRPISGEAVDHWRNFEPWLAPLTKSLGSVFSAYPSIPDELR